MANLIQDFRDYLLSHKDEVEALNIYYDQPHQRRNITYKMVKEVLEVLKRDKPLLAPLRIWEAYGQLEKVNGKRPESELIALVSLIRKVTGVDETLTPYDATVRKNLQEWVFNKQTGAGPKFNEEQMEWLRMIRDHIASSVHIELKDLDYAPFDAKGGLGMIHRLFGEQVNEVVEEMNEVLVA